jgi:AcrR family transcriptional regulator
VGRVDAAAVGWGDQAERTVVRRRTAGTLFQERGYDTVTVDEIAHAADVSTRTIYHYYAAKEDLVTEFHETHLRQVIEAIRAAPPPARPVDVITSQMLSTRDPDGDEALISTRFEIVNRSPTLLAKLRDRRAAWAGEIATALVENGRYDGDEIVALFFGRCFVGATQTALEAHVRHLASGTFWQHLARLLDFMERAFDGEAR